MLISSTRRMYSTYVFKIFEVLILISVFSTVNCLQNEGDACRVTRINKPGICTPITDCKQAQDDLRKRKIPPQVCGFSSAGSLVCCSRESLSSRNPSPEVEECAFPAHAVNVSRDQQPYKSWNKCIDLADSVFPCSSRGFGIGDPKVRVDACKHVATELIFGGTQAKPQEFPHMVALGYDNKEFKNISWDCGGTLISEEWVLTAAHCLYSKRFSAVVSKLRLGGDDLDKPSDNEFDIIQKVKHPSYSGLLTYNDIALLKMDRPVKYSSAIRPACLHVGNAINNKKAIAIGYGMTEHGAPSNKLLKVVLENFSFDVCSEKYGVSRRTPDGVKDETQICYGHLDEKKDTCHGDSGGPLQIYNHGVHCTYTVFGVTSTGKLCGTTGLPALYTRVSAFTPWIESVVWPN